MTYKKNLLLKNIFYLYDNYDDFLVNSCFKIIDKHIYKYFMIFYLIFGKYLKYIILKINLIIIFINNLYNYF